MKLSYMEAPEEPTTRVVLGALHKEGGFVGLPGLFYEQLAKELGVSTRRLVQAVAVLFDSRQIHKLKGGPKKFNVVGICLPNHSFKASEVKHLGARDIDYERTASAKLND